MLTGLPPFYHDDEEEAYRLIKESKIDFPKIHCISENAKDIITKLLR